MRYKPINFILARVRAKEYGKQQQIETEEIAESEIALTLNANIIGYNQKLRYCIIKLVHKILR